MNTGSPLLTISIPTWNRAPYLAINLEQLERQWPDVPAGTVELIVSNNASTDDTDKVVKDAIKRGMPIRYVANPENIGADANITQCFTMATGNYVIFFGDDDVIIDGGLALLVNRLSPADYGIVTIKPYGYNQDYRAEYPGGEGRDRVFSNGAEFLESIGALMTLISGNIINKRLLGNIDVSQFCGSNLVQVYLIVQAALTAKKNLFIDRYLVACKRNNSGGYQFAAVFVTNFGDVLDHYKGTLISDSEITRIERKMIVTYFPYYLFNQRLKNSEGVAVSRQHFEKRFHGRLIYSLMIAPILFWPRPFALLWGAAMTVVGRVLNGDLRRGVMFLRNKIRRK